MDHLLYNLMLHLPFVFIAAYIAFLAGLIALIVYYEIRRRHRIRNNLPLEGDPPPAGFPVEPPPASPKDGSE